MYSVSDAVREAIRQPDRTYKWTGTITCTDGTVIEFDQNDMIKGNSGTITRKVSSGTGLELGSVCAAELDLNLVMDVDRYLLYDAVIGLYYYVNVTDVETWGDLSDYTWFNATDTTWGEISDGLYVKIPMGVFNIAEVTRIANRLEIVAYDNMLKFDESFTPDSTARQPYTWLKLACDACDIELGMTLTEVKALTNGSRKLTLASGVVEDCETYRDMLRYLSAALCSVVQMDRFGKLVLLPYGTDSVLSFPASWRYSSQFSDFQAYYTGLYATYKDGGLSEYFSADDVTDDGLIYNVGINPFLQVSRSYSRQSMAQNIINALSTLKYAPYSAEVPCDPTLDPMDVIDFTDLTATEDDLGAITEIVCRINGKMTVTCAGENPKLNAAKSRYTKNIEGLLSGETYVDGSSGTSDFWMVYDDNSDSDQTITTETVVCSLDITPTTEYTKMQVNFTVTYTLDEASTVVADVQVDDTSIYAITDDQTAGNHTLTVTCGETWDDTTTREVNVLLTSTGTLNLSTSNARLTVFGYGWNEQTVDSGDAETDEGNLVEEIANEEGYDFGDSDLDWDKVAEELDTEIGDGYYEDDEGNTYTDDDGDGIYTDEDGNEYDGDGEYYPTDEEVAEIQSKLSDFSQDEEAIYNCMTDTGDSTGIPARIIVTNPPDVTEYTEGDTIDYTGIVVCAYTSATTRTPFINSEWDGPRHNQVPYEELTFPVTTATAGESSIEAYYDGIEDTDGTVYTLNPVAHCSSLWFSTDQSEDRTVNPGYHSEFTVTGDLYCCKDDGDNPRVLVFSETAFTIEQWYGKDDESWSTTSQSTSGSASATLNGVTYSFFVWNTWANSYASDAPGMDDLPTVTEYDLGDSYINKRIAGVLFGTTSPISTTVAIPVQWQTDYQDDPYEDTFEITVTAEEEE